MKTSRVDVTYLYILLPYIKHFNMYCGLCVRNCTFGATNIIHSQLLRCELHCTAYSKCPFKCSVKISNDGKALIAAQNPNIRHPAGMKICRPTRAPIRDKIKQQFSKGASVYRMYQEKLQKRLPEQRRGNNYDGIGKSRDVLRKIKSEGALESLLSPDVDKSLKYLRIEFEKLYYPQGPLSGAIHQICIYPRKIIVYSESTIRLFDTLLQHKNVILSWDATGSIIKEKNKHRLLYYELSITLPGVVNEDSIVPITFMISEAHALVDINNWLDMFRQGYAKVNALFHFNRCELNY